MRKIIFFTFLSFVIQNSQASDSDSIPQTATLMRNCVETICPQHEFSIASTLFRIKKNSSSSDTVFDKEIYPLVRAIANEDAYDKISRAKILTNWIKTASTIKSPVGIRLYNLFSTLSKFSKFQFKVEGGKVVVDHEKSRAEFSEWNDQDFLRKSKIAQKIVEAFLEKVFSDTDPNRVQLVYGSAFKAKVNEAISELISMEKKIQADPELHFLTKLQMFKEMVNPERIRAQFSADYINPDALQNLNQTSSVLKLFVALSTDAEFKNLVESNPIDIKQSAQNIGVDSILKARVENQKKILNGNNFTVGTKCKMAYSIAKQVLPSEKELQKFKAKIEKLKTQFVSNSKGLVCESNLSSYQSKILGLTSTMPLTWEQYLVNLKSSLQRGLEKSKRSTAENDEIDRSVQRDIFYGIALATSDQSNDQSVSSADQICQNLMINIFPDATYFANNSFVAGPLAIKFPEAEGILFHALGHWYYYFMMSQSDCSKLNFEKTSACLLANHTELSNTELSTQQKLSSQGKETLYQVEDWSDLISTLADEKSKNVACLFAQKLTDEEYKDLSLRNQDAGDSHSSELFRLLHLHFLKNGSLPAQCEQALIARGEKANFKNCLKLAH